MVETSTETFFAKKAFQTINPGKKEHPAGTTAEAVTTKRGRAGRDMPISKRKLLKGSPALVEPDLNTLVVLRAQNIDPPIAVQVANR